MPGILHALRRTAFYYGGRVDMISPWYVRTIILPEDIFEKIQEIGIAFFTLEYARQCRSRILSDAPIKGRSLYLSTRNWRRRGSSDLVTDPYSEGELLDRIQGKRMRPAAVDMGLLVDGKGRREALLANAGQ